MRFFKRFGGLLVAVGLLAALVGCAPAKIYIPVISKGFQHQFWQTVKMGAEAAAKQYNVEITFEGPPTEADIQPQVQMLVNDMAKNPSAICLAALDTNSVMDQLNQAVQKHIPIIGFDSGVPNAPKGAIYATAATDSYAAAGLAADKMFPVIKDKIAAASAAHPVTIVDFNQDATSMSVTSRGKGFRDEMIKLIAIRGFAGRTGSVTCLTSAIPDRSGACGWVAPGLYRFSRNPMYVGVLLVVFGQSVLFASPRLAAYFCAVAIFFHLIVVFAEEPHLRATRGASYEMYCRAVPRWLGLPGRRRKTGS